MTRSRANTLTYLLFLLLPVILVIAFYVYPILYTVNLSFFSWDGISARRSYVGFSNYLQVFKTVRFLHSFYANLEWLVFYLVFPPGIGLLLALLLDRKIRGESIFRVVFFLPYTIAPVAVASIWRWIYQPANGLLNTLLAGLGLSRLTQNWLGNPGLVSFSIMGATAWWATGFSFLVYLSGLRSLSTDLLDAARIDGASEGQLLRRVTLPLLRPFTIVVLGLSGVEAMRIFDIVWATTQGGPAYASDVLSTLMYDTGFNLFQMGQASAVAVFLFLLAALVIMPYVYYSSRQVEKGRE